MNHIIRRNAGFKSTSISFSLSRNTSATSIGTTRRNIYKNIFSWVAASDIRYKYNINENITSKYSLTFGFLLINVKIIPVSARAKSIFIPKEA